MSVYSAVVDVFGVAAYPTDPQFESPFQPKTIAVVLEDDTDDTYISFDGINDHAHLVAGTPSAGLKFEQNTMKVWARRGAVGTTPTNVQIIAED